MSAHTGTDVYTRAQVSDDNPVEELEVELLLQAVFRRYGYDFRQYAPAMLRRRLNLFRLQCDAGHLADLIGPVLHQSEMLNRLLMTLSVPVTEFFRDPDFFARIRQEVVPVLHTYAFINIWCAGCASGEEAYSWAILLDEAGLLSRTRIYATDINHRALEEGRQGVYSEEKFLKGQANYAQTGGKRNFSAYGRFSYGAFKMADRLQQQITFARHNIAGDGVFGEMVVISCRNVMIYFDAKLKSKCLKLFYRSLSHQGFLCLGDSESITALDEKAAFKTKDRRQRIYQKQF